MNWSDIDGGGQLIQWFDGVPVCFHDSEISDIWYSCATNAGSSLKTFAAPMMARPEGVASRCVIAIYMYRVLDVKKQAAVELEFQNVGSFELESDFGRQMVLDEITLEKKGDWIRVEFVGIVGIGGYIEADILTVRLNEVVPSPD